MLVISRSHPPELFEIAKEALDNITFLIQSHISLPWLARIFPGALRIVVNAHLRRNVA